MKKIVLRPLPENTGDLPESLHPVLRRIYQSRGIVSADELDLSLFRLPSPDRLKGMPAAVERLERALKTSEKIIIVGDFDADGATSTALAVSALKAMGFSQVDFVVPNRFDFGYGLSPAVVDLVRPMGAALLITVDNGISSVEGVAYARHFGMDVIVTDHHLPPAELPDAVAIINPSQPGCRFPARCIAGVGVVFYLMMGLRARLRAQGWFESKGIGEPNLADYLDLVALGTVADVVPLDYCNRVLVDQGLRRIRTGRVRPGIRALLEVANREVARTVASDLSFFVAPRLNAAGRLTEMRYGVLCLLAASDAEAWSFAQELDSMNRERREIEQDMQAQAVRALGELAVSPQQQMRAGLCLYDESWHQGVVGLLASRIKERYHRPVFCFALAGENELKGSGRSIPGFHIRDALDAIASRQPGLITRFGGHAMAAGLSLDVSRYSAFVQAFGDEAERQLGIEAPEKIIEVDAKLTASELSLDFAALLREAGPWGQKFPEPVFVGEFRVKARRVLAEKYLKLTVAPCVEEAAGMQIECEALCFSPEPAWFDIEAGQEVELVYRLDINVFNGRESLQLVVESLGLFG
ncbi:MAG: single-stranded-DNA-specific exonuclease RecJ [Pseudomonadales bacterium]|nr:single-stranded-DNA-specific exonuclease RecJ [Pseudomonadales bacterium]